MIARSHFKSWIISQLVAANKGKWMVLKWVGVVVEGSGIQGFKGSSGRRFRLH